jgi:hypothetical protein
MTVLISQKLIDFTVECEVSSRAYYEKRLQRPEWPGGRSGVTEGIGYDLGYTSQEKLRRDWGTLVAPIMLQVMAHCVGVTGDSARRLLPTVRDQILVPWDMAMKVFIEADVPEYTAEVLRAIPGADKLTPDCLGVLFSIGYNRGNAGWNASGDRFAEMREIRKLIMAGELDVVSRQIRLMDRLWPSDDPGTPDKGLRARRNKEADLWDKGLKSSNPAAGSGAVVKEKPPQQMPSRPHGKAEGTAGGGVVVAGGGAAKDASDAGASTTTMILIGVGVVVAVVVVMFLINKWRTSQNPILAKSAREPAGDIPTLKAA